ncbi:hypothetical protein AB0N89_09070 [Amycolatopsis sp. NPDC089917]|uniref:hypothetical protein n=1 Tax=Amycolatopsis sp. NPDC089917 TaxID=3155187 RepID=UPI003415ECA8
MLTYGGGGFFSIDLLPVKSPDGREEDLLSVNENSDEWVGFVAAAPVGTGDWWGFTADAGICGEAVYFRFHEDEQLELAADDFLVKCGLRS